MRSLWNPTYTLSARAKVQLVVFCYKDIRDDLNESEYNRRVCSCPQMPTFESLIERMSQQMTTIEKVTKMPRGSLWKRTYLYTNKLTNTQRWQIARALMSPSDMDGATERYQYKITTIELSLQILLLEFKETVGPLTNLKRSIQWTKINQKNYGK